MKFLSPFLIPVILYAASVCSAAASTVQANGVWSKPPDEYLAHSLQAKTPSGQASVKARLDALKGHKNDAAAPRLFALLGRQLYTEGYFSDAIACFKLGWDTYKDSQDHDVKMFADLCGGELSQMYARVGRMDELAAFLAETKDRGFLGQGGALISQSQSGLGAMVHDPGVSFKCGPYALQSILSNSGNTANPSKNKILLDVKSPRTGFSLKDVEGMSSQVGLNYEVFKLKPGAAIITPSVVHWKLDHFAAILEKSGDRYRVADPTFGQDLWLTEEAIREETSGYFLLPAGAHPGYSPAEEAMARNVHGKGNTGGPEPDATTLEDAATKPATCIKGMPAYNFMLMNASLRLSDIPISYSAPYGPQMDFTLNYNQRDGHDAAIYNVSSFGHQWTFNWFSYLRYDTANPNEVSLATAGGGGVKFSQSGGSYNRGSFGYSQFNLINTGNRSATRVLPDGTIHEYAHTVPVDGTKILLVLTKVTDPQGHTVTINYDTDHRITTIVDAAGGISTLCYDEHSGGNCLPLISSITDPYGRTAYFGYDSLHRLNKITDTLGLQSTFTYEPQTCFINKMTTPYGDTLFEGYAGLNPYIQATDPEGNKERVEHYIIREDMENTYPTDSFPDLGQMFGVNDSIKYRNSFYWDKRAMKEAPGDLTAATLYHFLHSWSGLTSRLLESVKRPLEGVVCYYYPGQVTAAYESMPGQMGNSPNYIGRRLDNGETQITRINYNAQGNPIETTDPAGRRKKITYAGNGRDMIKTEVEIGTAFTTVSQTTYDTGARPRLLTDASGAQTSVTYHSTFGLPISMTNALLETTTLDYTTTGLLHKIIKPDPFNYVELAYGANDQVTSVTQFPEAYTLRYEYDVFDRLTKTIYPDGTSEKNVYNKLDLVATRDRMNQWSSYTYDANRRKMSETNPANETIQYSWCGCGSLDALIDAAGRTTAYDYDIQGRMTSMTLPGTPPKLYAYEGLSGRLKTITDPKGQKRHTSYNIDDTIAHRWVDNVPAGTAAVTAVSYDWDDDLKRVTAWGDSLGTTTLDYYAIGATGAGKVSGTSGPGGTLFYAYDLLGRIINSSAGAKTYDSLGRVTQIVNDLDTFTYSYLPHSTMSTGYSAPGAVSATYSYKPVVDDLQLDTITNKDGAQNVVSDFNYHYDNLGRATYWIQNNGSNTSFLNAEYDKAGRLTETFDEDFTLGSFTTTNWRFDKAGNRLSQQISAADGVKREAYGVNSKDQVTTTVSGGPVHVSGTIGRAGVVAPSYPLGITPTGLTGAFNTWIETGSLTSATIYAADFSNHYTQASVAIPATATPAHAFEYDANGNMTRMVTTAVDGVTTSQVVYEWDARDQLVAIVVPRTSAPHRTEFTYDGLGRRIKIIELDEGHNELETVLNWDGLNIISVLEDTGYLTYYFDQGFFYADEVKGYYGKDHLGSIRTVMNSEDGVLATYNYDAYGNVTSSGSYPGISSFLYTGHYFHAPSGLYLAPYRAYDPKIGRWLSREPLGLDGPNLYHYVHGDPINAFDPTGLYASILPAAGRCVWTGVRWICSKVPRLPSIRPLLPSTDLAPPLEEVPLKHLPLSIPNANPASCPQDFAWPIPAEEDGWYPPKRWDGNKAKNPNGEGRGYPDKEGNVWMPETHHHGPHWDVQHPRGGTKHHVFPKR